MTGWFGPDRKPRGSPLKSPETSSYPRLQYSRLQRRMIHSASISNPIITWRKNHLRGVAPKLVIPNFVNLPKFKTRNTIITMSASSNSSIRNEEGLRKGLTHGVGKNDGLIIVDHGSRRQESNLMLNEFVSMFKDRTGYGIVEPAHMELAEPSIRDAFKSCVLKGAKRVIVSPFFLFPGRHWQQDIPALVAEASREYPGISYIITAPLGLHELMVDIMNDRIEYCLSHVAGDVDECSVCAGTGKCRLYQQQETQF